jgi:response regulator RpfG family c-di-GMP phosphodiesterase
MRVAERVNPSADAGLSSRGWATPELLEAYGRTAGILRFLTGMDGLDAAQRHVLDRRVARLFENRERFLLDFRATWTPSAVDAYRAVAGARDETGWLDELMLLFALVELTLIDGVETRGHLARTSACLRTLAETCGADPDHAAGLGYAALVHDVGLALVQEELVTGRDRVDSYESQLVDLHTRMGALLVEAARDRLGLVGGPLRLAVDIVRCHHERHDGLGPLGLAGEAIPYPARLFAIVDVYDTLRRERPQRRALEHAAATFAMQAGNRDGREQFDPDLLRGFLDCAEEFARHHAAHPEP